MYKLTYSPASPYVRKVRLAGYLSGLNDQIELLNPDHETHIKMKSNNPLGKIPVLMTQIGQYIFDSRVIVELLNDTSGKLYPNDDNKKIILTRINNLNLFKKYKLTNSPFKLIEVVSNSSSRTVLESTNVSAISYSFSVKDLLKLNVPKSKYLK